MTDIAPRTHLIDLEHLGHRRVIASCLLEGADGGRCLVDPGPSSTRRHLEEALSALDVPMSSIDALLLTHIHLDHAGAAGGIVRDHPDITVYVHERGAPHVADPSRLLSSAARLYGEEMDLLWGEVLAVPESQIHALGGGERINIGSRRLRVAYTPGHASHHVSYLDEETALAFVGDTAGIRILNAPYVVPPTPPPDIDLELWKASLRTINAWHPDRLFLTHFGVAEPVRDHLDQLWERLTAWSDFVKASLGDDVSDDERAHRFATWALRGLRDALPGDTAECYVQGGPPTQSFQGLLRYWRKREEALTAE